MLSIIDLTLINYIVKHTINFTFTHSVMSNDGTKVYVIISNVINIDVTKRISTKQTVHTAYIHIKDTSGTVITYTLMYAQYL